MTPRRVVLVGFMGSGKSTVGPLLAEALSWRFEDLDAFVERREGRSVAEIFRDSGEAYFRAAEVKAARELLASDGLVLGSGGGWAAVPGRLGALPEGTVSVWLRVSAETAVYRAGGGEERPLLSGPNPLERARDLLSRRTAAYAEADLEVDTEGSTPIDVTEKIVALLETNPGSVIGPMNQT